LKKQKQALKKIKFINRPPLRLYQTFLAVAFVTIVAMSGAYYVLTSSASWSGALSLGSTGSGWCMDDKGGGMSNGNPVVINRCSSQEEQKWVLNPVSTWNGHTVYTVENFKSHLCLDNRSQSSALGNPLIMYTCNAGDAAQQFVWTNVTNKHGLLNIQNDHCVDNKGAALVANNPLDMYTCKSTSYGNQEWFEIPNTSGTGGGTSSTFTGTNPAALQSPLKNASGYHVCLDDYGDSSANGTKVDVWQCNGRSSQAWHANVGGAGTFGINGKCASAAGNAVANGTPITLYTCNGSSGQKWTWANVGGPTTLVNTHSGKCLDDKGYSTANGTQLELYTCNGGSNQLWYPVTPSSSTLK